MTNVDIPALKALAETGIADGATFVAVSPTTVLALIARIEELEKEARNHMIAWTAGLDD